MTDGDLQPDRLSQPRVRVAPSAGISALICVHIVLGVLLSYFSADEPAASSAVFLGLVFAQTSLLGMWGGLGGSHGLLRAIGVVIGTVYLWLLCGLGIGELESDTLLIVAVATGLVAAVCWVVRLLISPIARFDLRTGSTRLPQEGLQFGIRHLMLLTLVVACLVTVIKAFSPSLGGLREPTMLSLIAICFASIALAAIWAMLGLGPLLIRGTISLAMSGCMGWALVIVIDGSEYLFWPAVAFLQTAYMVVSLSVIRQLGYRLLQPLRR